MDKKNFTEEYKNLLIKINREIDKYKSYVSNENIIEFKDRLDLLDNKIEESLKEGRTLKIGIVGEVKAGKSSFLNALIFDGEDVLPKASTPMTAALTKITYSEKQKAKVVFYSKRDWERISDYSARYISEFNKIYEEYLKNNKNEFIRDTEHIKYIINEQIPLQYRACKELTDMTEKNNLDLNDYLEKTVELIGNDVVNQLEEYIGAHGKFTSLVKHVELSMNIDLLKGIEIVDTPGLNDPILSRSDTTRRFIGQCDVVFLLSYCGQFLTNEDIRLMNETLPNEGIRNVVIVGSKFDSGILDYPKKKCSLGEAVKGSIMTYRKQAEMNINNSIKTRKTETLIRLKDSLPPEFVSSLMYSVANKVKNNKELNDLEKNITNAMSRRFAGFNLNYDLLMELSNITSLKEKKLNKILNDKEKTINEKNKNLINDSKGTFLSLLEDINIEANKNLSDIRSYDKENLEKKLKSLESKLNSLRGEIRNIFALSAVNARKILSQLSIDVREEVDNYLDIKIDEKSEDHEKTYRTGFLGLSKQVRVTTTITRYASVTNVISNIRKYIVRCRKVINRDFENLFDIYTIKKKVTDTVLDAFRLSEEDFNTNDIAIPLEIVLKKITIPSIEINEEDFNNIILNTFSGAYVEGEEIHKLVAEENKVISMIADEIDKILKEKTKEIEGILSEQASCFVDNIIEKLSSNVNMLKAKLDDKEESILRYEEFLSKIKEYKNEIVNLKV